MKPRLAQIAIRSLMDTMVFPALGPTSDKIQHIVDFPIRGVLADASRLSILLIATRGTAATFVTSEQQSATRIDQFLSASVGHKIWEYPIIRDGIESDDSYTVGPGNRGCSGGSIGQGFLFRRSFARLGATIEPGQDLRYPYVELERSLFLPSSTAAAAYAEGVRGDGSLAGDDRVRDTPGRRLSRPMRGVTPVCEAPPGA